MIPQKIKINSDGNVLEYTGRKDLKGRYEYVYVVSETKKGTILPLDDEALSKLIKIQNSLKDG